MGLFDNLNDAPETPEEEVVSKNPTAPSLEAPEAAPETPEEVMMVARTVRKQAQEEEGMAFGNVNDLGLQFNNTVVKAAGAPVEVMEWALNRVAGTLFPDKYSYSRDHLIDGEWKPAFHNTVGSTKSIRTVTDALGQTSDETPDTYMGYTGATLGEGAAFLMGGAGLVQKTKTAGGVVGAISRNADDALRTKLGTVVAGETVAAGGAGMGRAYAEDNEYGETGSLVVEFTAGAFALLSAAGAKKIALDPLTAKLKNMTQKEALEKLSKEEIAEVVAEGQRVGRFQRLQEWFNRGGLPEDYIEGYTIKNGVPVKNPTPTPKDTPTSTSKPDPEAPEAPATTATPKDTPEATPAPKNAAEDATIENYWDGLNSHLEETRGWNVRPKTSKLGNTQYEIVNKETGEVVGSLGRTIEDGFLTLETIGAAKVDGKRLQGQGILDSVYSFDAQFRKQNNLGVRSDLTSQASVKKFEQYHSDIPTVRQQGSKIDGDISIERMPKADPEGDAIDASIAATKSILEGDRTGGKGARVTAEVKPHFKAVAVEMSDQFNAFAGAKNADDAMVSAKAILARIDRFIDFDRIIAKKDYAQGSELVANAGHVTPDSFKAGITAEANQRTADLQTLKNMLEDFTGGAKNADEAAEAATEMAKKLTPEEKLTAIRSQMEQISRSRSTGPLMSMFDGYFTTRTAMALNQVKTGLVGTMSAGIKHLITPLENTLGAVDGAARLKDVSFRRRAQYALADIAATREYLSTFKNHWRALGMNMRNTMLETGDSQLLYKEAQAYKGQEGITTQHSNFFTRRNLNRAARTEAYNNATNPLDKSYKGLKKAVLNNNVADAVPLIFNYGFGLIGSIEEISLMTLSRRAQRSMAIKQGIREGAEDIGQYVDDWMNDAFMKQEDGSMRINYDPKYADGFNEARYDHFRNLDIPASDIRVEAEHAIVAALNKVAESPTEVGMITKFIMMFRGVPTRAGAQLLAYTPPVAYYKVAKIGTRKLASAAEGAIGEGNVSFGKYASKIGELKADIKRQTKLLDDPNASADVRKEAEAIIAQSDEQIARLETYQRADDYRDIARSLIATGMFLKGYQMGRAGVATGSQSQLTDDQKFAAQKVDGAPNDWKVLWGDLELDYRYAEPLKGAFGMGASWGARQASIESGNLTPEQTATQFFVSAYRDMFLDMPALQGAKTIVQTTSANPETRAKAATGLKRQAIPAPAEIRNILKYDEEFIGDTTQGDSNQTAWRAAIGTEQDNYRLTVLGEPKQKEGQTLMGHLTPFGGKETVERTELDNILLEDAMSFRSLSEIQTSVSGFQLKKFVHVDDDNGETLYSKFGQLITNTKIGGKNQRQALEKLIKTKSFKDAYKRGYTQNEQGQDINEGVEMIKDVMSEYRSEARETILNSKAATDYVDSDGNNIYDILKEREAFSERPESLLESLNLK